MAVELDVSVGAASVPLAEPAAASGSREDDDVAAVGEHQLEVAAPQGLLRPPAVLDQPLLAHRLHRQPPDRARASRPGPTWTGTGQGLLTRQPGFASTGLWLLGKRHQHLAPLRHARVRIDLEHPQHRVGAGGRARLAHRLGDPPAALLLGAGERELLAGLAARAPPPPAAASPPGPGARRAGGGAHRRAGPGRRSPAAARPAAASRRRPRAGRRGAASAASGRAARRGRAGGRSSSSSARSSCWPETASGSSSSTAIASRTGLRPQRLVLAAGQPQRAQARPPEAIGDRVARQRREPARAWRPRAARARWGGPSAILAAAVRRAARPAAARGSSRAVASGTMPARPRPRRPHRRRSGRAPATEPRRLLRAPRRARSQHPLDPSPEPARPPASKNASPGAPGLDLRADPLQPPQRLLPGALGALGVGRDQGQLGAARERLAQPHPGVAARTPPPAP